MSHTLQSLSVYYLPVYLNDPVLWIKILMFKENILHFTMPNALLETRTVQTKEKIFSDIKSEKNILQSKIHMLKLTSTSNPFLCAADFFLQLGSCKEAVR